MRKEIYNKQALNRMRKSWKKALLILNRYQINTIRMVNKLLNKRHIWRQWTIETYTKNKKKSWRTEYTS